MSKPIFPATVSLLIGALALMPLATAADDGVTVTFVRREFGPRKACRQEGEKP